jgi:topoisomerase IA-like protein
MAEKTILVCDACGKPAVETVTIKAARGNFVKDLCATHVNELVSGARRPRRGRPKTVAARPAASKPAAKKTAARKPARKKTAARRPAKKR